MNTIEFRRVPVVNGKAYASMDEFRQDSITQLIRSYETPEKKEYWTAEGIGQVIVEHADEIIEILTLNTCSRPQMRKERKARKPRKDTTLPLPDNT